MRNFPSEKALVKAYWRKLARSIGAARQSRSRVVAKHAAGKLQTRQNHASHSDAATGLAARAGIHSNL
jgi:hypothetical protein